MSKFNTTTRKLEKLWEQVVKNNKNITEKSNEEQIEFFNNLLKQQNFKVPLELYNSGNINLDTLIGNTVYTAIKEEKLPALVSYFKDIEIQIPEIFLPFVKYSLEVNPIPNADVHCIYPYEPSSWSNDNIEVRGDGNLIYKGQPIVTTSFSIPFGITHLPSDLVSEGISLSLTKETWDANIDRTSPLSDGEGKVIKVTGVTETPGLGTNPDTVTEEIEHLETKTHKITFMSNTQTIGIGRRTTQTYDAEDNLNTVIEEDVSITINFGNVTDYTINLAQATSLGLGFSKDDIETLEIEKSDRVWLFYSTELQKIFKTTIINTNGDFQEVILDNLPNTNDGDTLPYTNITVKRNINGINEPPEPKKQSEGSLQGVASTPNSSFPISLVRATRKQKNYIKISNSEAPIPTFKYFLNGSFVYITPSTDPKLVEITNPNFNNIIFEEISLDNAGVQITNPIQITRIQSGNNLVGLLYGVKTEENNIISGVDTTIIFESNPVLDSNHSIISINDESVTAIGTETITEIIDGEETITVNSNVTRTKSFSEGNVTLLINETVNFPVYDDTYTQSATTYTLTTENHKILAKQLWQPEERNVSIVIKAYLVNPLYWREQRRYNKNDV